MKTVMVSGDIADARGLFFDLIEEGFEVCSISSDLGGTRIVLEDEETKDPLSVADRWVGRPAEKTSRATMLARQKTYEEYLSKKEERLSDIRIRLEAERELPGGSDDQYISDPSQPEVQVLTLEPRVKPESWGQSLVKKIKSLW